MRSSLAISTNWRTAVITSAEALLRWPRRDQLIYYPTVTRDPFRNRGRITDLITSRQIFNDVGQEPLDIVTDRIMMCGSPAMLDELKQMFEARGFLEGSHNEPGHFVIEKAFVER